MFFALLSRHTTRKDRSRKEVVRLGWHTLCAVLLTSILIVQPAFAASDQEHEMCRRAKALGYDESRKPVFGHEVLSKTERCTKAFWREFKPQPLNEILGDADSISNYHEAIEQGDCKRAENLLRQGFSIAYPGLPSKRSKDMMLDYWRNNMITHFYPSLGLCVELHNIRNSLKEVVASGIKARPFWSLRENHYPRSTKFPFHLRQMYAGVANMIYALNLTQSPKVALALLRLSREGKAIKLHPDYELYLALRLQGAGIHDPLIDTVIDQDFAPRDRARIAKKAKQKTSDGIAMFPN